MKWENLKKNKCPQCNKDFTTGLKIESNMQPTLFIHKCGFKIYEKRMNEIVSDMNTKDVEDRL